MHDSFKGGSPFIRAGEFVTPAVSREDALVFFREIERALSEGAYPPGHKDINGRERRSALGIALERTGIKRGSSKSHLDACIRAVGHGPDWSLFDPKEKPTFSVADLPSYQADIDEIIEKREREYARRSTAKEARRLIPVKINTDDPIGIIVQGDPHLDDPGTDLKKIRAQIKLINDTPGLFGASVGDYLNNWRGRLAHLHGSQSVTQIEAVKLLEWYIKSARWLFLIGGNHDVWAGAEDPIVWFRRGMGGVYEWHGARIALQFPNGAECRINCRHNFAGQSIYNPAQGPTRAAKFGGDDHVYIAGHIHTWADMIQENPVKDIIWHAIQLSSFKKVDDYPEQLGKDMMRYGDTALILIRPRHHDNAVRFVKVYRDIEEGAEFLTWLRKRKAA